MGVRVALVSNIRKTGFTIGIYPERKIDRIEEIPPTAEQVAQHARAVELYEELLENPFFESGSYEGAERIWELKPTKTIYYAETIEEWLERCRAVDTPPVVH